jgi:hypothetical protein
MPIDPDSASATGERAIAVRLFNETWTLLGKDGRTSDEDDAMLHMAHASRHHWGQVGTPVNLTRGEWQCSRVYSVLRRAEPAAFHALRCLQWCQREGIADFDLAFAYEAMSRAASVLGDGAAAQEWANEAYAAAEAIADPDDRELVLSDLESIPGIKRAG